MVLLTTIQTAQQGGTRKTLKCVNLKFKLYYELLFNVIDKLIQRDRNIT